MVLRRRFAAEGLVPAPVEKPLLFLTAHLVEVWLLDIGSRQTVGCLAAVDPVGLLFDSLRPINNRLLFVPIVSGVCGALPTSDISHRISCIHLAFQLVPLSACMCCFPLTIDRVRAYWFNLSSRARRNLSQTSRTCPTPFLITLFYFECAGTPHGHDRVLSRRGSLAVKCWPCHGAHPVLSSV